MHRFYSLRVAHVFLFSSACFVTSAIGGPRPAATEQAIKRVQAIVTDLEVRLEMPQHIEVSIVPADTRMVSVQRIRGASGGSDVFMIHLDQAFFDSLNREELTA